MKKKSETNRSLHIVLPEEGHQALHDIAKKQRRALADVVREALEEYMRSQGSEIDLSVERGGYRGKKRDSDAK